MTGGLSGAGAASDRRRVDSFSSSGTGSPNDDFRILGSKSEFLLRLHVSPAPTPLAKDEADDFADEMVEARRNNGLNRAFMSVIMPWHDRVSRWAEGEISRRASGSDLDTKGRV